MLDDSPRVVSPHLKSLATTIAHDEENGLPSQQDGTYQPFGRPANKPVFSLHIIEASGNVRSFQYAQLDSNSRFTGEQIILTFLALQPVRVVITGRNLWRAYDYIHQHRATFMVVASRDFAKDGQPIVTAVSVQAIAPEDGKPILP